MVQSKMMIVGERKSIRSINSSRCLLLSTSRILKENNSKSLKVRSQMYKENPTHKLRCSCYGIVTTFRGVLEFPQKEGE